MATTKVSGNLIQTATVTGNNIATGTITTNNISTSVNLGGPKISSLTYPGDDTAADTAGGQTVVLTGNGFVTGASVLLDGVAVGSATVTNTTSISFTTPVKTTGSYIVYVVNTDGSTAILVPGIQYSGVPTFSTSAGSLGTAYEYAEISSTIAATGDGSITFSQVSGTLPDGVTLASNGQLSGTTSAQSGNTTFSFTVRATDDQNQDTDRNFSVTINIDDVEWSAPANNATITTYEYAAISNTFAATSAAGRDVVYTADTLPANVTITGSTVSGTPTTVGNTTSLITATSNTTNRTAAQTLNFVVQEDVVTWSSPANNVTYTLAQGVANTTGLAATSAAGKDITFTANSLPTGLDISGNTITGTPTAAGTSSSLITATAATTNRTAVQTINWVIQLAADAYWKNVSLLVGGTSNTVPKPFTQDSSINSSLVSVVGDAVPTKKNAYATKRYSYYFDGTGDGLSTPTDEGFQFGTGDFTVEFWLKSADAAASIIAQATASVGNWGIILVSGNLYWQNGFAASSLLYFSHTLSGAWTHYAFVRNAGTLKCYVNGSQGGSISDSTNYNGTGILKIGNAGTYGDFGGGYLSDIRIVKGTAVYTSAFAPPAAPLTAISGTTLLTAQSSTFSDASTSNRTMTTAGNIAAKTESPYLEVNTTEYGSTYFDGTGDYLTSSIGAPFGTGDFTIELWAYLPSTGFNNGGALIQTTTAASGGTMQILLRPENSSYWRVYTGAGQINYDSPTPPVTDEWIHHAIVRVSGVTKYYFNGVEKGSIADTTNYTGTFCNIANYSGSAALGYIQDVRIVQGTGVYTTTFTPPSEPLTAIANTQLLTCQYNGSATNNIFVDQSPYNNIITRAGNVTQGTFSPFSNAGWSTYFPGSTGNYVTTPSSTDFSLGAGDYTIEAWCYSNSLGWGDAGCVWHFGLPEVNAILRHNGSIWQCYYGYGGASFTNVDISTTGGINQWVHHAVVRQGTTVKWYINGVERGSGTDSYSYSGGGTIKLGNYAAYGYDGYISNFRLVQGTAVYTSAFTPPTAPLAAIANTKALLLQSNRLIDNGPGGHALTVTGSATVQAFSPVSGITSVPTSYSNYFDGTGDYLTINEPAGTAGDLTVEFWLNCSSFGGLQIPLNNSNNATGAFAFEINTNRTIGIYLNSFGSAAFTTALTLNSGQWNHVALVRTSGVYYMYINGTRDATSYSNSGTFGQNATIYLGRYSGSAVEYYTGYISNLRFVYGTAVYTGSSFTVPTSPLTAITNTRLLTCQSATMIDNSTNNFAITASGNVTPRPFNPFGTTTSPGAYSPIVNGGSMYFDGTGDYLTTPQISFGTGDFTVEMWSYLVSRIGSTPALFSNYSTWTTGALALFAGHASAESTYYNVSSNGTFPIINAGTIKYNQWQHLALVRSGNLLSLYVDGVVVGTSDVSGVNYTGVGSSIYVGTAGDAISSGYINGYLSDYKITKGAALYKSNFYPGSAPATPAADTTLLLNGTSGGIIDAHGTTNLETVGDVKLAPEDPYAGGYYSTYFSTQSSENSVVAANTSINLGAGDFTVEGWFNATALGDGRAGFAIGTTGTVSLYLISSGTANWQIGTYQSPTWSLQASMSTYPALGTWSHHAIVRRSGNIYWYIDGVQVGTASNSTTYTGTGASVGYWNATGGWLGYVSNFRIVVGTAVYTSAFTPPTAPLTAISGTQLLTAQSNKFIDNSTNAYAMTVNGTPQVKSTNPFQKNSGTSVYFDGTGDYLKASNSPNFKFGTGEFTVEFWMNTADTTTNIVGLTGGNTGYWNIMVSGGSIYWQTAYAATNLLSYSIASYANAWTHYAFVRTSAGQTKLYINGTERATASDSTNYNGAAGNLVIGYSADYDPLIGYIKDLRITKGYARYTSSFTPPIEPFILK